MTEFGNEIPGGVKEKRIRLAGKLGDATSRLAVRVFVDSVAGTADYYLNEVVVAKLGQTEGERIPGIGRVVGFMSRYRVEHWMVLSHHRIGPWNGELPRPGKDEPCVVLANHDIAFCVPRSLRDGKFQIETASGPLELLREKVQAVEFGGALTSESAAGRVRLADGSALRVDDFRWDGHEFTARSAALGDIRLPASAVRELIYDPAPVGTVARPQKRAPETQK